MRLPDPLDISIEGLAELWKCPPDQVRAYVRERRLRSKTLDGQELVPWEEKQRFEREECCASPRNVDARVMRSMLIATAIMARGGYGSDLTKPYELARAVQRHGDLLGLPISDETLANIFKRAREILEDESGGQTSN